MDGSAEKRVKIRDVATQWAPEGNEWKIQTHQVYGVSWAATWRLEADAIRQTHIFFLLIYFIIRSSSSHLNYYQLGDIVRYSLIILSHY